VKSALADADGSALQSQLEAQGFIEIAGERLEATEVEVRAERHESLALVEDAGWAVALDLELTDALRAEGTSRELVRALNDARKSGGFEIADRITVVIDADDRLQRIIEQYRSVIATEVLATELSFGSGDREIELDGTQVSVSLRLT
jgi:isoleucyl-tRNA synthetase